MIPFFINRHLYFISASVLFFIGIENTALADRKVILLVSLPEKDQIESAEYERTFRNSFAELDYELEVKHNADIHHLWTSLNEPETTGLLWLSHCRMDGRGIPNFQGFDCLPVFGYIKPHLRFLAIIGCNSNRAINRLNERFHLQERFSQLSIIGFDGSIGAIAGLTEAIAQGKEALKGNIPSEVSHSEVEPAHAIQVRVLRRFGTYVSGEIRPAVQIVVNDQILAVLPEFNDPSTIQETVISIDPSTWNQRIAIDAGQRTIGESPMNLGQIEFESESVDGRWDLRLDRRGMPIAHTIRQYHFVPKYTLKGKASS